MKNLFLLGIFSLYVLVAQTPQDVPAAANNVVPLLEIADENVRRIAEDTKAAAVEHIRQAIEDARGLEDTDILQIVNKFAEDYEKSNDKDKKPKKEDTIREFYTSAEGLAEIYGDKYQALSSKENREKLFNLMLAILKATNLCHFEDNDALLALALWSSADEDKIGSDLYELVKYLQSKDRSNHHLGLAFTILAGENMMKDLLRESVKYSKHLKLAFELNPFFSISNPSEVEELLKTKSTPEKAIPDLVYSDDTKKQISRIISNLKNTSIDKIKPYLQRVLNNLQESYEELLYPITPEDIQNLDKFVEEMTNGVKKDYKSVVALAQKVAEQKQFKKYKLEFNKKQEDGVGKKGKKLYKTILSLFYEKMEAKGYDIIAMINYPKFARDSLSFNEFDLRLDKKYHEGANDLQNKRQEESNKFLGTTTRRSLWSSLSFNLWRGWMQCRIWFMHFLGLVGVV